MDESTKLGGNYRIEVSGWDMDNDFFVEQTELSWDGSGDKKVLLHRTPDEGGVVFIRLLSATPAGNTLPVTYEVGTVHTMDRNGQTEILLKPMHPRIKVSPEGEIASYAVEDFERGCEPEQDAAQLEYEEILQP